MLEQTGSVRGSRSVRKMAATICSVVSRPDRSGRELDGRLRSMCMPACARCAIRARYAIRTHAVKALPFCSSAMIDEYRVRTRLVHSSTTFRSGVVSCPDAATLKLQLSQTLIPIFIHPYHTNNNRSQKMIHIGKMSSFIHVDLLRNNFPHSLILHCTNSLKIVSRRCQLFKYCLSTVISDWANINQSCKWLYYKIWK